MLGLLSFFLTSHTSVLWGPSLDGSRSGAQCRQELLGGWWHGQISERPTHLARSPSFLCPPPKATTEGGEEAVDRLPFSLHEGHFTCKAPARWILLLCLMLTHIYTARYSINLLYENKYFPLCFKDQCPIHLFTCYNDTRVPSMTA